jgi:hypothetical protein
LLTIDLASALIDQQCQVVAAPLIEGLGLNLIRSKDRDIVPRSYEAENMSQKDPLAL